VKQTKSVNTLPARRIALLLLVLILLGISGCGGGGSSSTGSVPPGSRVIAQPGWNIDNPAYVQPTKTWTVLVYLDGANNLETYGLLNVNQMETVGSSSAVNIIVQFKRYGGYDTSDGNWNGTRRYYVTQDSTTSHISSAVLSDNATLNMGDPNSLQAFVQWGINTYPAQHYCLVLWDHGAGWRSQPIPGQNKLLPGPNISRGFGYDDQYQVNGYDDHIDTNQLAAAMDMGNGKKWDLVAWDASLMQIAEVAYQIRNEPLYIVGSEESPPGTGFPYDQILGQLVATPNIDGKALGIIFAQKMLAANGTGSDITESVLDASQIAAIAPALNNLGTALTNVQTTYGTAISDDRGAAEAYAYPENHDLINFCQLLQTADLNTGQVVATDPGVAAAITQVQNTINAMVLFNTHGTAHPNSNGLSVYLPTPYNYQQIDIQQADGFGNRYSTLALANDAPHWQNFLANGPP
jgi:hypothetical protein